MKRIRIRDKKKMLEYLVNELDISLDEAQKHYVDMPKKKRRKLLEKISLPPTGGSRSK